jgi:hypothetical protein
MDLDDGLGNIVLEYPWEKAEFLAGKIGSHGPDLRGHF